MMEQKTYKSSGIKTNDNKQKKRNKPFQSLLWILITSFITAALLFYYKDHNETEQSLTYFPDDPQLIFESATTSIHFQSGSPYTIQWMVQSSINHPTYLRQDVSFLFKDQKLVGILSEWQENTRELSQVKTLKENESGYFEAISVHHAENHYPNNVIRGKEVMSYDHFTVMTNTPGSFTGFKVPTTTLEKQWSSKIWLNLQLKEKSLLSKATQAFHLNPNDYYIFPLSYLHVYENNPLPGLSQKTTHRVTSQLWEGLYKNYALGVPLSENDMREPIGSMMPIILYSKKADKIYVIIQLGTGEMTMLKQSI